jgi:hypothetical protein
MLSPLLGCVAGDNFTGCCILQRAVHSALPAALKYSAKNTFFHIYASKEDK